MLNNAALTNLLPGPGTGPAAHGSRASFRGRAAECANGPCEVCELALAHVNSDRVGAACRGGDPFDRGRVPMNDRAAYVA